ncbi:MULTISPECIES: hypothetical protein [Natrialbaceae]|uniref:hypothetical protein n=1 Tax=Natrialbaceae TaxID=1644061 RepID=UPI00207CB0AD|nr:hypothetical protein [Natronococcus sp. CG52]
MNVTTLPIYYIIGWIAIPGWLVLLILISGFLSSAILAVKYGLRRKWKLTSIFILSFSLFLFAGILIGGFVPIEEEPIDEEEEPIDEEDEADDEQSDEEDEADNEDVMYDEEEPEVEEPPPGEGVPAVEEPVDAPIVQEPVVEEPIVDESAPATVPGYFYAALNAAAAVTLFLTMGFVALALSLIGYGVELKVGTHSISTGGPSVDGDKHWVIAFLVMLIAVGLVLLFFFFTLMLFEFAPA